MHSYSGYSTSVGEKGYGQSPVSHLTKGYFCWERQHLLVSVELLSARGLPHLQDAACFAVFGETQQG